ncbi:V-type ATP synthase subunit D [Streptomyces sp. NBC_00842]
MQRVAIVAPREALPTTLVRLADAGCVEIDRADGFGPSVHAEAAYRKVVRAAAEHAVAAAAVRIIGAEVLSTRQRVRALQRHWIPNLRAGLADRARPGRARTRGRCPTHAGPPACVGKKDRAPDETPTTAVTKGSVRHRPPDSPPQGVRAGQAARRSERTRPAFSGVQ